MDFAAVCECRNKIEMNLRAGKKRRETIIKNAAYLTEKYVGKEKKNKFFKHHTHKMHHLGIIKTNIHNLIKSNVHFFLSLANRFERKEFFPE